MNSSAKNFPGPDPDSSTGRNDSRGDRPAIHSCEVALAALVSANLCFLPWAFGGVDAWSQFVSAGLALAALGLALVPRPISDGRGGGRSAQKTAWSRLARFPVFWAGLVLFAYVAVQGLNPAFAYHQLDVDWWMTRVDHIRWLPAGMDVPFGEGNAWHTLLIWVTPWALTCAIWIGLTRLRTVLLVLTALEVNAFAFAAFGLVQRASGSVKIFGIRVSPSPDFFAALIYKNHAAAFFGLLTCVGFSLVVHSLWRSARRPDRPGPAILHVFFTLVLMLAVGLSFSVSGIVLLALLALLTLPVTIRRYAIAFRPGWRIAPALAATATMSVFIAGLGATVGGAGFRERVAVRIANEGTQLLRPRLLAARQGFAMFEDRWAVGWGAGCFRYGFTKYQKVEPELYEIGGAHYRWEHVHDDWLELLIELGVFGVLPLGVVIAFWLRRTARLRLWRNPAVFPLVAGLALLALHAFMDFPFQNPAVLNTACSLLPLVILWGEADIRHPSD